MSAAQLGGAVLALGGAAAVYMQVFNAKVDPELEKKMPEDVKRSPLKKTLSNAGLYPNPEGGSKLKSMPSGSMAVFQGGGAGAALTKGGGEAL